MVREQLIFIDDSGDPGLKNSPSNNFIMAAALFIEPEIAEAVSEEMTRFRKTLGWADIHEFKFRKTNKETLKCLLHSLSKFDFEVYAVYIDKSEYHEVMPIMDEAKLYNWALKELLMTMPLKRAKVRIDGRYSKQYELKTATYLRREINTKKIKKIVDIRFEDSSRVNLIQLADVIAGAVNRSLQLDKTDAMDYIRIFRSRIISIKQLRLR